MQSFINPDEVLDELDLKPNLTIADFGCGSGGFTIPLARRVPEGLVNGLDIQEQPLSALKSRLNLENIVNVKLIKCDLEGPHGSKLPAGSVDLVMIPNVLFQIDNKNAIISEAYRILKSAGRLVIIDWNKNAPADVSGQISAEEVVKIVESENFKLSDEFRAGQYHYGLIFAKN